MEEKNYVKDKKKLAMVLKYHFTEATPADVRTDFARLLKDLCFGKEEELEELSVEYTEDVRNVRNDLKTWIKANAEKIGKGSRILFIYTKPERPYIKERVYTF